MNTFEADVIVQLVDNAGNELEQYLSIDGEAANALRMVKAGDTFDMDLSDGEYSFFVWRVCSSEYDFVAPQRSIHTIFAECITRHGHA